MRQQIDKLNSHVNLTETEMSDIMEMIMSGQAQEEDMASFLLALRAKGPTIEEITACAKIMRKYVTPVNSRHDDLLDTCGTGGDRKNTINISTMTAFVVAGAGCIVAKHGNRSVSSKCGSACVLEGLGLNLDLTADQLTTCLDQVGIAFLFAQKLHPAMKHVAPVRKRLKVETIFNILGPLTNPANATHQIMGVYNRDLLEPMANVLQNLGLKRALVVHGADGLDEITITDKTFIAEYNGDDILTYDIIPEELGLEQVGPDAIVGDDVDTNIRVFQDVLAAEKGAHRDIVVLNAAYALYTAALTDSINEGLSMACQSIDSGAAWSKFEALRDLTQSMRV
jgi:anthranilate phosphoribosyltransferase